MKGLQAKKTPILLGFLSIILLISTMAKTVYADSAKGVLTGSININEASKEELQKLPGIGTKKAEAIIAYRERRRFHRVSQIMRVKGIGPAMYKKIKAHIVLEGPTDLRREPEGSKDSS